jgi:hypothetical protein
MVKRKQLTTKKGGKRNGKKTGTRKGMKEMSWLKLGFKLKCSLASLAWLGVTTHRI